MQFLYLNTEQIAGGTQSREYTVQTLSVKHDNLLGQHDVQISTFKQ